MAGGPLGVLAHVDEDGLGILREPGAGFIDGDFLDNESEPRSRLSGIQASGP